MSMLVENFGGLAAMSESELSGDDKTTLLRLARSVLLDYLGAKDVDTSVEVTPPMLQHRATFVTWRTKSTGDLRGCIGELIAQRPLIESIRRMATVAATEDPRFLPVRLEEVPGLQVEISALTPMYSIRPDEVEVGKHGLMIRMGSQSGLLLPQVPLEQGWDREEFLCGVCWKAGLPEHAWQDSRAELQAFEAEVWGEE